MAVSIDAMVDRGERIESLVACSDGLSSSAAAFARAESPRPEQNLLDSDDDIMNALAAFDKDHQGFITPMQFRSMMTTLGEKIDDAEIDEMIAAVDEEGSGRIDIQRLSEMLTEGGSGVVWSADTIRLSHLPSHFSIGMLVKRPRRYHIDRCPATAICIGTALIDYGSDADDQGISAFIHLLLLCNLYGWSWSAMKKSDAQRVEFLSALIGMHRQVDFLLKKKTLDLSQDEAHWLPLLDEACGLPPGALRALYVQQYALPLTIFPDVTLTAPTMRSFGEAAMALLQRRPVPQPFEKLATLVLPYSTCFIAAWDVFVWPESVPDGTVHPRPFPFSTVVSEARNYYDAN
jgi:hypothetical protein